MSGCDGDSSNGSGDAGSGGGANPTTGSDANNPTNGSTQPCSQVLCTITSETFASVPANRARLKIGVGEDVALTVSPGPATWSLQGDGVIAPTSGTTVVFRAGDTTGAATITAQGQGCSCSITFMVIGPSDLVMRQSPDSWTRHDTDYPSSGFLGVPYISPDDVSFYNVRVREKNSAASVEGYYAPFGYVTHMPQGTDYSGWLQVMDCVPGLGSKVNGIDRIWSGHISHTPSPGRMVFPIQWEYSVWGRTPKPLTPCEQRHLVDDAGTCWTSKGGETVSAAINDLTSAPDPRWAGT
jgi:hypothetical protein